MYRIVLLGDHAARAPRGMERSGLHEIVRADRHSDAVMGGVAGYLFTDAPPNADDQPRGVGWRRLFAVASCLSARGRSRVMMCV